MMTSRANKMPGTSVHVVFLRGASGVDKRLGPDVVAQQIVAELATVGGCNRASIAGHEDPAKRSSPVSECPL